MLFNSFSFLIFFLAVCSLYFALPFRFRALLLLVASYGFYISYSARCSILLFALTIANYTLALLMDSARKEGFRKMTLGLSIVSNISLLFSVQVLQPLHRQSEQNLRPLRLSRPLPLMALLLPIGISFYTFKIMNYTIDVYRRKIPAERKFTIFALFVAFFPQLISGPIDRAAQLLPQFIRKRPLIMIVSQGACN